LKYAYGGIGFDRLNGERGKSGGVKGWWITIAAAAAQVAMR
jgi:hypothetical protein